MSKKQNILLLGADGQLGCDLQNVLQDRELTPLTIKDLDITKRDNVIKAITSHRPEVVINAAAYTHVDNCETQQELAMSVNAEGVKNICEACKSIDAVMVHISTDYVFDGKKGSPYVETDKPNPGTVYGRSKLLAEQYVTKMLKSYYIVRTSGLFGVRGCMSTGNRNFVDTMLYLAKEKGVVRVVNDQVVSPTYSMDLAEKMSQLIDTGKFGLYHITNSGKCTWYEFAEKIFQLAGTKVKLEAITTAEYPTKAKRPAYSVLDHQNLRSIGLDDLRTWDKALKAYLQEKKII